jgi:gluconate 5-dehydrogenase
MSGYLDRLFGLDGRVAIVAGASRGIGAAIANGLREAGARVVGVGRSCQPEATSGIEYRRCDVRDHDAFSTLCESVARDHGGLDILAVFDATLDVNLRAAYAAALACAEPMAAGGGGTMIFVTSIGSVLGFPDNPGYVASKGGLRMLVRALAEDLGSSGIRVNALAPGYVRTGMTEASHADAARHQARRRHMIVPRWGEPADLVGPAIFLASSASGYITGQDVFVDGGWTARGLT